MEGARNPLNTLKISFLEVNITYSQGKVKSLDDIINDAEKQTININQDELRQLKQAQRDCNDLYPQVRDCYIQLNKAKRAEKNPDGLQDKVDSLRDMVKKYSVLVAKMLGHVFAIHGTEDDIFVRMVDYYEDMHIKLTCLNELIDKQDFQFNRWIDGLLKKPDLFKKIILEEFGSKAKFVKDCFLAYKSFETEDVQDLLPTMVKIQDLAKGTAVNKKLTNQIPSEHPDSSQYQVIVLRELAMTYMDDFM